ncbi:hypothetical protein H4J02_12925 [Protaetiibacter sp. SSC-01]|uniref:PRC-barrel domain-containing protein n=1 Tax=Protaetiibacter sp. SSC-01 TaxID=2759943 RepID=UPI0016569FE2|nr:hypothetical protein [Protaetiibacter sp. SSC-01]QNO37320.1 hypothetical protein H4J02_12925 [Protaetiibacter sp. SSC-01]
MILSDLLGHEVRDAAGEAVGRVVDVRFRLEGATDPSRARAVGLIVSPRAATSYLGYERIGVTRPVLLARLLRWMHRGSFLVPWEDLARIETGGRVLLREGYRREPSALR